MSASRETSSGLGAALRIKRSSHFSVIKQKGRRMSQGCLAVNWKESDFGKDSRLGVVTSRRIGSAVVRNRARRLLRECFRLHRCELSRPVDMVLVARASIAGMRFTDVERDLIVALSRAGLLRVADKTDAVP